MPTAYAYVRFSLAIQSTGYSEDRQVSALDLFTKKTGVEVSEVIYDRGKSAYRGDNAKTGRFKDILDRIESGSIKSGDFLVVESIDRITRQRLIDGVDLLQGILMKGIKIYTTSDEKTYSYEDHNKDFETLMMIQLIAQRANEESKIKASRQNASWRNRLKKAQQGEVIIKKGKNVPFGLRVVDGQFVVNQEEQKEVTRMFELLLDYGINSAIKKMNQDPRTTKQWENGTVYKMITSRSVIGCLTTHKMDYSSGKAKKIQSGVIENYYPNIIDPDLFFKVRKVMKSRKNNTGKRTEQDFNIFKNQIFCVHCGDKLYYNHAGSRYKGKMYPHFKCNKKRVTGQCDSENIRFEYVLCLFLDALNKLKMVSGIYEGMELDSIGEVANVYDLQGKVSSLLKKQGKNGNSEFEQKRQQLQNLLITKENINESVNFYIQKTNGKIPLSILENLADVEEKISIIEKEVDDLKSNGESEVEFYNYKNVVELFLTAEGRIKLNNFFKENEIKFKAGRYGKKGGMLSIYRGTGKNEEELINSPSFMKLDDLLAKFGLVELQDLFDLKI